VRPRKKDYTPITPAASEWMLPPDDLGTQPIVPWLKLDPGTRLQLYCCSSAWLGAQTHWAQGRMKIHTTPNCRWCEDNNPIRFYFFLHLCSTKELRSYVAQLSAGNIGNLVHAKDEYSSLRGCRVELARRGRSANSPTVITFLAPPLAIEHLPPEFNIRYKLARAANWDDEGIRDFDQPKETTG